jgi:hypothetical protein
MAETAATAATSPTGAMIASTHALNVHNFAVTLSIMRTRSSVCYDAALPCRDPGQPGGQLRSINVGSG